MNYENDLEMVEVIISINVNITTNNKNGITDIMGAAIRKYKETVNVFIKIVLAQEITEYKYK